MRLNPAVASPLLFPLLIAGLAALPARADIITDWNQVAARTFTAASIAGNPRARATAILHVAMFDAVASVEGKYAPVVAAISAPAGTSSVAAAAAAAHHVLMTLAPGQKAKLDEALAESLKAVPEGPARDGGLAVGAKAGAAVLADRQDDALTAPDDYRPHTTPGAWVPTAPPIFPEYAKAKLWGTANNSAYRPGPPPTLESAQYARDYNEVKALGGRASTSRTPVQADAVKLWGQPTLASTPDQVARQVVEARKPAVLDCARYYAHLHMAVANTFMADWDAKFHYNYWRPVTAIRNGDRDNNDATERDARWTPLNATPMHPEYPSQAAMLASVTKTVTEKHFAADVGPIKIVDPVDPKVSKAFASLAEVAQEMNDVRVWGGVHFRTSLDVSTDMGKRIATDIVEKLGKAK